MTLKSFFNVTKMTIIKGSLVWDKSIQNLVFSGTFWGGLATCLPSIFLVQRLNPKWAIFATQANKVRVRSMIF